MQLNLRRVRLGLGAVALAATAAAALGAAPPTGAPAPAGQPTPYPLNTLGPMTGSTSLPYPAYGTPVPGVDTGVNEADVPSTITLQQAILIGFARNPLLTSARADVGIQSALVRLQRAGLLPSLSGSATFDRSHQQPITSTTTTTGANGAAQSQTQTTTASSVGLSATLRQLIYDGGKIAAGVNAAQRGESSSADTYRRDLQTVAYNVAVAYYNYLAAERTTQVDLEIVREDEVQENLVRAQVKAGTEAPAQIATAQLPTAQARLAVVRAQGAELAAEAAFANAMGLNANVKAQPVDDAPVFTNAQVSSIPIPSYDVAAKRALAIRPDYDASVQTVRQAEYSLKAAKLGLFPTLTGSASASDNSTDPTAGTFRNNQSLGVALAIPIYDQGITAANVSSARASLDNANALLKNTELTIQLNVKQALTSVVSARAALDQTQQEYATAVTNLRSTQAQYRAGVTTLPLLLNAQVQLTQALTDQVTAVYTLRQSEQAYLYAVGANYDVEAALGRPDLGPIPTALPTARATSHTNPARRKTTRP